MSNLPGYFEMGTKPWECPRCKRMNSPYNPSCFCSPEQATLTDALKKPKYDFAQTQDYMTNGRCSNCNGYHGIWNGRPFHRMDLQTDFNPHKAVYELLR